MVRYSTPHLLGPLSDDEGAFLAWHLAQAQNAHFVPIAL
jgi:hypothetical protein